MLGVTVSQAKNNPPTLTPRYPVYIISKGRHDNLLTAKFMIADGVPFRIVVEPQEREKYAEIYGDDRLLILPFSNLGKGSIPARNWVWEHSKTAGFERHWIFDDNIRHVYRRYKAQKIRCNAGAAIVALEDFVDRYENIGIAGMNYFMFLPNRQKRSPFVLNCHVYSNLLIKNDMPQRWRGWYNEDTDLCLQVLSAGLCTVQFNAFMIKKMQTMTMKGGNTDVLYDGDGRLKMAKSLERMWPGVVETKRRFKRPQHVIKNAWGKFNTQLIRKPGIEIQETPNEYGMNLEQVKPEIKSEYVRSLLKTHKSKK